MEVLFHVTTLGNISGKGFKYDKTITKMSEKFSSEIRSLFDAWTTDLRSRIPKPYFWTIVWVKSTIILSELYLNFFLYLFKNKIIYNFVIFVATKKEDKKYFSLSSFVVVLDPGFGIRVPGSG
jgi:hypothetical protein